MPPNSAIPPAICHVEGCDRKVSYPATQTCKMHYYRFWKFGCYELVLKPRHELCTAPGCDRKPLSRVNWYCTLHYQRRRQRGGMSDNRKFSSAAAQARLGDTTQVCWQGETRFISEWAKLLGLSQAQMARRLATWTLERAMTQLPGPTGKKPRKESPCEKR